MSADFSPVAATRAAAIVAVRYNRKRKEADSVREMPPALLNVPAQVHHDQAARQA